PGTSCTIVVNVTGTQSGVVSNTTGAVSSTNGGTGATSNTATLIVASPPTIGKAFSASAAGQNTTVTVTFTIVNPNSDPNPTIPLTGVAFSDTLPAGLVVATPSGANSNCGGTLTANAGSGSISLTGGAIDPGAPPPPIPGRRAPVTRRAGPFSNAAGFCVINVNLLIAANATGTLVNVTGPVSAAESGAGAPSNAAILEVVQAPTVTKAFGAASVPLNGSTSLTFNFSNPNSSTALVGTALNDSLPSGLVVATPNGLGGTCSADVTADSGSSNIAIANLNLNASSSCTVVVNVTGTTAGTKNNATGQVTSTFDDGTGTFRPVTGGTASASIAVVAPPSIAKAFNPSAIAPNGVSTLTFTITNPAANTVPEAGVGFTDTLPANVVVATPNGLINGCGGTATATAGSGNISLSGGSVAASSSCTLSVNITSATPSTYNNTSGAVSSTNGGTGNTASASLKVANAALSITKTHSGSFQRGSTGNNYTITVSSAAGAGPTVGTVTVVDTLPNVPNTLVPTAMSGTGWTCNLGTLTCTRSDVLAPGASYPATTLTVNAPINIQPNV